MGGGLGRLLLGRTHAGALPGAWGLSGDDGCLRQRLRLTGASPGAAAAAAAAAPGAADMVDDEEQKMRSSRVEALPKNLITRLPGADLRRKSDTARCRTNDAINWN
uniref:Uncharacterized protein n=1 Tax=Oryza sativa subsp. japonica TaxID=39947 RepID=Q5Z937_ORYSJ|nr:hypothetical protein [Oryza sativa Japonica Group]